MTGATAPREGASAGAVGPALPPAVGPAAGPEQIRARYPDEAGFLVRDGVRIFWERYGSGERTVLLLPTWSIVNSRVWKLQIPYLARYFRVVTFDGRGSGKSDRPAGAAAYSTDEFAADTIAVMDATGTERAALVSLSCGALWATILAAEHPERVDRIAYIGPAVALAPGHPDRSHYDFDEELTTEEGWARYNSHYWRRNYPGFVEFFSEKCCSEPHSTKQIEDFTGWALETEPETMIDAIRGQAHGGTEHWIARLPLVRCPTLVIHGDADLVRPHAQGAKLAEATGGLLITFAGSGHLPNSRSPVRINLLLKEFAEAPPRRERRFVRASARRMRALYVSSPIGLGHAHRDVAIARELRRLRPGLEIDWLAQHPVTDVLEDRGERIHPASAELASESAHIQSEHADHELHCFQALRRMDEILLANFMVFHDVVSEERYDLWIADEAWDLDYFLHENPELKSAAYAWLSDFVGLLPMRDGGEREAALTADYNAEMVEQIARFPRLRDRSIFIGDPDDIVPDSFGPGLPSIREWTEQRFSFSGYVTDFEPLSAAERERLRASFGYAPDDRVCVVAVGGSGVGLPLLRRVLDSLPEAKRLVPGLRMVLVAGPRIDPATLSAGEGVEVLAYVPDLHRHLAVCDLAVVQGGLATTMELTAHRRPFIYVPLKHHFEQNFHVRHRLERHRAGRRLEFDQLTPVALAAAIAQEISREPDYLPVPSDGATRAAATLAELL